MKKFRLQHLLLAGLTLLLSGCGGNQNPYQVDTGSTPAIFNGLWDGLSMPFVFVFKDAFGKGGYALYSRGAGYMYWIGWVIGAAAILILIIGIVSKILYRLRLAMRRTRP
jgi:hypothetical protein